MLHKTLEAKATVTDQGTFTALAAAYSVDRVKERILPGAFEGTIARWQGSGKQIPLHWDHGGSPEDIIGTVDPTSMKETDEGLEVKGQLDLDESEMAREAWRSMKKNRVGLSFGYLVTDDVEGEDGIRELKAVDLFEVTVTPAPANPDTRFIDMKSANPSKGHAIWKKWADEHIVEEPEVKCETCGHELTAEQVKAIEDARTEEPSEAKVEAQDPLRRGYEELALELSTRGIDVAEPPKVEEKPTVDDPLTLEEHRRRAYDLMLETI